MKVELRDITKVKPYKNNPRKNDGAVDAVATSIKEFGFRQPIVVDKSGTVIVGHTRLKAAEKLGMKKVPVHVADMTPAQARAYRLADNKTNELAEWDDALLKIELEGLDDEMNKLFFDAGIDFVLEEPRNENPAGEHKVAVAALMSEEAFEPGTVFAFGKTTVVVASVITESHIWKKYFTDSVEVFLLYPGFLGALATIYAGKTILCVQPDGHAARCLYEYLKKSKLANPKIVVEGKAYEAD